MAVGQDVIQPQAAQLIMERGIKARVALMFGALLLRIVAAVAALWRGVLQPWMGQERAQGIGATLAIHRIKIGVAQQDHGMGWWRIGQATGKEVQPEGGLVMVAAAVAILGPVEDGGRGDGGRDRKSTRLNTRHVL